MMSPAVLRQVLRLRERAVAAAERELTLRIAAETEAARTERLAIAALAREAEKATDLGADDAVVEAYAAWFPRGQSDLARARDDRAETASGTAIARAGLAAARSALEAVTELLARHAATERRREARAEQAILDAVGQARRD